MKILQIFGAVVAVHLLAFIFIFASPGCSSSPRNVPTPDATVPSVSGSGAAINYSSGSAETMPPSDQPAYLSDGTPGRATPTRPGSPNAAAIAPTKGTANVAPVTPYTIQRGDSLWTIAKKHHITVAELTKANNLSGNNALQPGKKLMIPGKPGTAPADTSLALALPTVTAPAEAPVRASAETVRHVVASGESLGTIARKYQVTVGELAAANNITDPAKIRVGQPLVIPASRSGGNRNAAKSSPKSNAPVSKPAVVAKPAPVAPPPAEQPAVDPASQFEIKPPPAGQDLDAGLKDGSSTEVPTIKVEEPAPDDSSKI